jgi:hypothetical protein
MRDRRTDGQTDGQTDNREVIPKCHPAFPDKVCSRIASETCETWILGY